MFKKLIFLVIGAVLLTGCNEDNQNITNGLQELNKSTVYYFHGDIMCMSCHKIESYTKQIYDENFKNDFDLKIVNTDRPENKHFVKDYGLYTQSIILVRVNKNGEGTEYKNLDKVWSYVENENKFKNYVKNEIQSFLVNSEG